MRLAEHLCKVGLKVLGPRPILVVLLHVPQRRMLREESKRDAGGLRFELPVDGLVTLVNRLDLVGHGLEVLGDGHIKNHLEHLDPGNDRPVQLQEGTEV